MVGEPMMLTNNFLERRLFTDCLTPDMRVLEWGSGESTLVIASFVRELVSIEHNNGWVKTLGPRLPRNVKYFLVPPNIEPADKNTDGTFEEFHNYVLFPKAFVGINNKDRFDVIFIDGRARVACAKLAAETLLKPGGFIFIHDYRHPDPRYRRVEYEVVETFLEHIDQAFAMAKFIVKK